MNRFVLRLSFISFGVSVCCSLLGCGGSTSPITTTPVPVFTATIVAGTGVSGHSGDGGAATSATFNTVAGVAVDSKGNFYIADAGGFAVHKVTASTGVMTLYAGTGVFGSSGDGGLATSAQLTGPWWLAFDASDNLYIADRGANVIRMVNASTGVISTVAGVSYLGYGTSSGDGGLATKAGLSYPQSVYVDAAGNLFIGEESGLRVRKVTAATGIITTIAGTGIQGGSTADNILATAEVIQPDGLTLDASGNLIVCDRNRESVIRVSSATGLVSDVAGNGFYGETGNGGAATLASLSTPTGVAYGPHGDLFIGDYAGGSIRKVAAGTGVITALPSFALVDPFEIAFDASGNLYVADGGGRVVWKLSNLP